MQEPQMMPEWVKAARAGEKSAWNALYRQYYPGMYAIALRICNDIPFAQDVVQDTFIKAYLNLAQLKEDAAFGGWIKRILIHASYRASRRNQTNENLDNIPADDDCWWEDEINRKLDWLTTRGNLYTILSQLPEALRSTLLLRYFSTFQSYEEIARILCIPVGTVRSRLNQAKFKLAENWKQHRDTGMEIFNEGEEWNSFYYATFSGMHMHDDCKKEFMDHLQKDMQIVFPGGKINTGRLFFESKVHDDRQFGSWLEPANVLSSGNISIIEATHYNSPEYPYHCPSSSVLVLYRNRGKVTKMNFHVPLS